MPTVSLEQLKSDAFRETLKGRVAQIRDTCGGGGDNGCVVVTGVLSEVAVATPFIDMDGDHNFTIKFSASNDGTREYDIYMSEVNPANSYTLKIYEQGEA